MKHIGNRNKGKKVLYSILGVAIVLIFGIACFLGGQLNSVKKNTTYSSSSSSSSILSSKVIKSSGFSLNSESSSVDGSESDNSEGSSSVDSSSVDSHSVADNESTVKDNYDSSLMDNEHHIFAGKYANNHGLANDGYTILTWLEKNKGMTEGEACEYVDRYYPFFYGDSRYSFLTSGDVQTINSWRQRHRGSNDDENSENSDDDYNNDVDTNNDEDD